MKILLFYDEPIVYVPFLLPFFLFAFSLLLLLYDSGVLNRGMGRRMQGKLFKLDRIFFFSLCFLFCFRRYELFFVCAEKKKKKRQNQKRITILNSKKRRHGLCLLLFPPLYFYMLRVENLHCFAYVPCLMMRNGGVQSIATVAVTVTAAFYMTLCFA